jgi:xylulokinase
MLYIGIDLGTSAVKLLLMQEDGTVQKIVTKEYALSFPHPGWSEQNPADWWTQSIAGLKELTAECDKSQIAGISFGGQMHGLVILDENDEVIRPAILWNDGRTMEETEYLNTVIGKEKLSSLTGNIAFAGFTAPKILWVKKHEPENFARIKKMMLPKDYLAYRLTGVSSTDYSDASGMLLLDVEHKCWSKEMLDICSVKEEWMPKLFESYEKTGTLLPEVAKELGFPESCIVAAGAGDNAAAAVGTGCVGAGKCNLSLGTSGTIFITNSSYGVDPYNALHSFAHADGSYHLMGCMLSAASCNKWWMEEILQTGDFSGEQAPIDARAAEGKLGENHVYFLPYLMGERSPHNDPQAKGAFIGMTLDTSRADMLQAVFEGVAYALRDSLEVARRLGVAPQRTTICGGGAKSPLWRKIVANIMNLNVDTVEVEEGPAYGGAILAAVANGAFTDVEQAVAKIVRIKDTTEPDPALVQKYEECYQKFVKMYPALKETFQSLV